MNPIMRCVVSLLLAAVIFGQGCTSAYMMQSVLPPRNPGATNTPFVLSLRNGTSIRCIADRFVVVPRPSTMIVGLAVDPTDDERSPALRCVEPAAIDSSFSVERGMLRTNGAATAVTAYRLKDGSTVCFVDRTQVLATPDSGAGIWYANGLPGIARPDTVRYIRSNELSSVGMDDSDALILITVGLIVIGVIVLIWAIASMTEDVAHDLSHTWH
jgi:hypothetical protein